MKLSYLFSNSIQHSKHLFDLYVVLNNLKSKRLRDEWEDKFFENKLAKWPKSKGLDRVFGDELMLIGSRIKILKIKTHKEIYEELLLRSALVFGMAAFDRLMHEIVLKDFSGFCKREIMNDLAKLPISKSYQIAQIARRRTGKGGQRKRRPGNDFKREISEILFTKPFLGSAEIEKICKGAEIENIWKNYGKTLTPISSGEALKANWNKLYQRRNHIAHELDVERSLKPKSLKFKEISSSEVKSAFELIEGLGNFIISEIEN